MNYSRINTVLFILINLSWVVVVVYDLLRITFTGDFTFNRLFVSSFIFILMMTFLQVVGFLKLKKEETTIPIFAVILLAFIVDLGGFKQLNYLLVNIFIVIDTGRGLILEATFLQAPSISMNLRLSDFSFKQIGFNGIAYIQMFFLLRQESLSSSKSEEKKTDGQLDP